MFSITTEPSGLKGQIKLHFRASEAHADSREIANWIHELAGLIRQEEQRNISRKKFEAIQQISLNMFEKPLTRWLFAGLILMSFLSDVAQAQYQPEPGSDLHQTLQVLEVTFTVAFLLELLWNLFANWLWPFLENGWSIFDAVIVGVSLVSLLVPDTGDGVKSMRLVRVVRAGA